MRWRRWCRAWSGARMPVQTRRRLALDRADRREPQLLQRPAGVPVHGHLRHARGLRDPPLRLRQAAPRAALGLRLSRREPGDPVHRRSSFAQPIRRVFGTVVFRAREHAEMPPPGDTRPARLTVELRDLVWDALYAPIAGRRRLRRRPAQPSAVPDHPPVPQPRSSPRSCILLLVLAIWP